MKVTWKGSGKEPVDAGIYEVNIKGYRYTESLKGNPQISWEAKIIGPENSEYVGRTLFEQIPLIESTIWKLGWFISSLGIDTKMLPEMDTNSEGFKRLIAACVGRRVWWTVVIDVYDGNKRNKVVDYARSDDQPETVKLSDLEDIPEFLKKRQEEGEQAPF